MVLNIHGKSLIPLRIYVEIVIYDNKKIDYGKYPYWKDTLYLSHPAASL